MNKTRLLHHLQTLLQVKVDASQQAIDSTRHSLTSDTKSSAGDKHEVGRAMVQQELDKLEEQRVKLITLQHELTRVPVERSFEEVAFGSLVGTDQGTYFVAIGWGRIESDGGTCFVISLASPLGQALNGKSVGDRIAFNGRSVTITSVT